ncbi:MAG: ABC transporter permease [Ilumatobacteraceae bacterium]
MSELLEPGVVLPRPAVPMLDDVPADDLDDAQGLVESISPGRMALKRFLHHKVAVVFSVIFLLIALVVIFAPWTSRYPENFRLPAINGKVATSPPSSQAWFGTNSKNFDLYSQLIWGGRVSLFIGLMVAIFSSVVGTVVGAIAGFKGGRLDDILMRVTDLFLAFPTLVLLLVLRNLFDNVSWLSWLFGDLKSVRFMVVLLVSITWMAVARIVRGVVLSLREREFVEAAVALGSSSKRIVVKHLIPNSIGPIIVALTTSVVGAIVAESTLSFFGYGIDPVTRTSWGTLLADSKGGVITGQWWLVVFPSAVFVLTILCINFIGDALRDAFDPKQDVN